MIPDQFLRDSKYHDMCQDWEPPETPLSTTGVAGIDSSAATQASETESCRHGSNEKLDRYLKGTNPFLLKISKCLII
jgi:hypothetical protein